MGDTMNYAKIKHFDIANGEGVRVSLFVSGCSFHCKDCFNQDAWDFNYGKEYTSETENEILELVSNPQIKGLSILGGDPLWQDKEGLIILQDLVDKVHALNKTVWLWSGFTWESIHRDDAFVDAVDWNRECLINRCDIFVDGQFEADKKDLSLKWRGSSNQRVIDVQNSLRANEVVLYET